MQQEYNKFVEELKKKTPDEIIKGSYENVIKEELVNEFLPQDQSHDIHEIKALNEYEKPLEELYQYWLDSDGGIHEILEDSISNTLEDLVEYQNKKMSVQER